MKKTDIVTLKNARKVAIILGVVVDSTQKTKVLRILRSRLNKKSKFYITTPNPEIILAAQNDKLFKIVLNSADISLADGIGLSAAEKFINLKAPRNLLLRTPVLVYQGLLIGFSIFLNKNWLLKDLPLIKGREMFIDLIALANKKGWKVFLLGGEENSAIKTAKVLKRSYKKIRIEHDQGPVLDSEAKPIGSGEILKQKQAIQKINSFKPHLLFVGFGAPKQEKWIYGHIDKLNIGGAMVVGGTFDFISGKTKLPPGWMENFSIEWLWRLFTKSGHLKRVFAATIIFPYKVFIYKLGK